MRRRTPVSSILHDAPGLSFHFAGEIGVDDILSGHGFFQLAGVKHVTFDDARTPWIDILQPACVAQVYGLVDLAAERFDAGVRLGEQVAKDMVAVRIGPDFRMAVVATPDYFDSRPTPKTPQELTAHNCINLRLPTYGGLYAWEFEKGRREISVRVGGQLVFNSSGQILRATLAGLGLAYLPEDLVAPYLEQKKLQRVLEDWCTPFPGYHLYYPSRRQSRTFQRRVKVRTNRSTAIPPDHRRLPARRLVRPTP